MYTCTIKYRNLNLKFYIATILTYSFISFIFKIAYRSIKLRKELILSKILCFIRTFN